MNIEISQMVCNRFVAFSFQKLFATNSTVLSEFGIFRRVANFGICAIFGVLYRIKELIYCWLQEIERERAKARQVRTDGNRNLVPENLPEQVKGDSRDIAAKKLGMSGKHEHRNQSDGLQQVCCIQFPKTLCNKFYCLE